MARKIIYEKQVEKGIIVPAEGDIIPDVAAQAAAGKSSLTPREVELPPGASGAAMPVTGVLRVIFSQL